MTSGLYNLYEALTFELVQISKNRIHDELGNQPHGCCSACQSADTEFSQEETSQRSLSRIRRPPCGPCATSPKWQFSVTRDSGPSAVSTNNAHRFWKITDKSLCKKSKAKKRKRRTHQDKFRGVIFSRPPKMCVSRAASNVGRASLLLTKA